MTNDWFNDPSFDPDDFASNLFGVSDTLDTFGPTAEYGQFESVSWGMPEDDNVSREDKRYDGGQSHQAVIRSFPRISVGANEVDGRYIDRSTSGNPASERTTERNREKERIANARQHFNPGGISSNTSRPDEGSNAERRFDSRAQSAIKYAREQLSKDNIETGQYDTKEVGTTSVGDDGKSDDRIHGDTGHKNGILEATVRNRTSKRLSRSPKFTGCTFQATFYKLSTLSNGEWLLQMKSLYEDREQVIKLNESQGIVLRVTVERVSQ